MRGSTAVTSLALGLAACSAPEEAGAPAPTADEAQAVEEAEWMIPENERQAATRAPGEDTGAREGPAVEPLVQPDSVAPEVGVERAE